MDGTADIFIYESDDKSLSFTNSNFYDVEAAERDFIEHFGDSVSDSEFADVNYNKDNYDFI